MTGRINSIHFDEAGDDYIIDGQGLKQRLQSINYFKDQMTLVKGQPSYAADILTGEEEADLINDYRALYVCGHCGGYDGTLIGVKMEFGTDYVIWSSMGIRPDIEDGYSEDFPKVPDFYFTAENYRNFIRQIRDTNN